MSDFDAVIAEKLAGAPPFTDAQREELVRIMRPHVDVWRVPKDDLVDERGP